MTAASRSGDATAEVQDTSGRAARAVALVVTWNSAGELPGLVASLGRSTVPVDLVVVDNDSADDTVAVARAVAPAATVLQTGRNAGYAGAINHGLARIATDRHVLVVNPDVRLEPDTVQRLLATDADDVGIVVPSLLAEDGSRSPSLRRDPTTGRTLAEAVLGGHRAGRLGIGELITDDPGTERRRVDWATGAVMLVTPKARAAVGEWDESFFLYSEEVDYCQRVRDAGLHVVHDPRSRAVHVGGEMATSPRLWSLRAVNRVRHQRRRRGDRAVAFHLASLLFELRRAMGGDPVAREAVRTLLSVDLDREAERLSPREPVAPIDRPVAVVVPAHQEQERIGGTLTALLDDLDDGEVDVIVACNGCTDDTALVAAEAAPGATVLDLATPSKIAAMNTADDLLRVHDRDDLTVAYLDADVTLHTDDLRRLVHALDEHTIAASPRPVYDLTGTSLPVRSYLRVWQRLPFTRDALSGTGVFVLSPEARRMLGRFPDILNDDAWVNAMVPRERRRRVGTAQSIVAAPADLDTLLRRKLRVELGNVALRQLGTTVDVRTRWADLVAICRDHPRLGLDMPVFLAVTAAIRWRRHRATGTPSWR